MSTCLIHSFLISAILAYVSPIMAIRRLSSRMTTMAMKMKNCILPMISWLVFSTPSQMKPTSPRDMRNTARIDSTELGIGWESPRAAQTC